MTTALIISIAANIVFLLIGAFLIRQAFRSPDDTEAKKTVAAIKAEKENQAAINQRIKDAENELKKSAGNSTADTVRDLLNK